jgi:SAM-dependent methyltransferase
MAPLDDVNLSYRVGDCTACGFSFAYELPDDATYQRYYRHLSKYDVGATLSNSDHARFQAIVALVQETMPADACVVDIGCGEGALLAKLSEAGFAQLHGIDPAPNAPALAQSKYGLTGVRSGFLRDAATMVPLREADGVCIAAVLEHLPNLRNDLAHLLGHLKRECVLIVEVPSLELFQGVLGEPFGEFSLEHVNYFSSDSLARLMISLGWRCITTRHFEFSEWQTGSVLSAFARSTSAVAQPLTETIPRLDGYVASCTAQVQTVLGKIPPGEVIVWGAGSHSARLLPMLASVTSTKVRAVVDGNPNLVGKALGDLEIQSPELLRILPLFPVVISSFRAQAEIAARLQRDYLNPLVLLYP